MRGLAALRAAGCNVTMPHKREAAQACDELAATAATLEVVNTVLVRDGRLVGDSTDGGGFVDAAAEAGVTSPARRSWSSARAARPGPSSHALAGVAGQLRVAARRADAATAATALAARAASRCRSTPLDDAVAASDVIVNATPLGMRGETPPFATDRLGPHQTVFDTVYAPAETPLLAAARRRRARGPSTGWACSSTRPPAPSPSSPARRRRST